MSGNLKLKYELRKWQHLAFQEWVKVTRKGIVRVATGGGKTVFAEACILEHLKNYDSKIFIIVPTVALAEQWFVNLIDELNASEKDMVIVRGTKKISLRKFNIMVINTARKVMAQIDTKNCFLIVDECHRSGSIENSKALHGNFSSCLGLSATPEREYDQGFDEYMVPLLGPIFYSYGIKEAKKDKILTNFEVINLKVPFLKNEKKAYQDLTNKIINRMKKGFHADTDDLLKILFLKRARLSNSAKLRIVAAIKLAHQNKGKRTIIFHESTDEASLIGKKLKEFGHSVCVYHSKIGINTRISNLKLFKEGIFDVLVCCKALDEGLNVPDTSVAIIASSSASQRQRVQRLGRVLRPHQNKNFATVYTVFITKAEEERLQEESADLSDIATFTWKTMSYDKLQ